MAALTRLYPLAGWMRNNCYPWNKNALKVLSEQGEAVYSIMHMQDSTTLFVDCDFTPADISEVKITLNI